MIATMARRRVHLDATLIAFQPAFFGNDAALLARDRQHDHPAMVANWRRGFRFDMGWQADDYRRAQAVWPRLLELTRRLYEAGVPMTIGTDQANPFIAPGISVSREMALHQQAGIPAWAVLRMATSDAARLIGVGGRTGALRRGLEADILFIAADPLPDLNRVAEVRAVVNNGVLHRPADLLPARPAHHASRRKFAMTRNKKTITAVAAVALLVLTWSVVLIVGFFFKPSLAALGRHRHRRGRRDRGRLVGRRRHRRDRGLPAVSATGSGCGPAGPSAAAPPIARGRRGTRSLRAMPAIRVPFASSRPMR